MDKDTLIEQLGELCGQLTRFGHYINRAADGETLSKSDMDDLLKLYELLAINVGKYQPIIEKIVKIDDFYIDGVKRDIWSVAILIKHDQYTREAVNRCATTILRAIGWIQNLSENDVQKLIASNAVKPITVFIAHEGMTIALQKLKEFLEALGVQNIIAEIEPSDGRSVENQVNWAKGKADCAIILATKGKVVNRNTNKSYMGMNVADELGRARETFKNRIILLLEEGVETHSNISEIVRQSFTPHNMEQVYIKIIREFRNRGLISFNK